MSMLPLNAIAHADWAGALIAFGQVLMIDLVLAGDNALAVGMAASGLAPERRRKVILAGLGAAVVLRIGFALAAQQLLGLIGLRLAGGVILLGVAWKMWRDVRAGHKAKAEVEAEAGETARPAKSFGAAFLQILLTDLAMSLDNVLAVAGAALKRPLVLAAGLLLSIGLMGVAADAIARLLNRAQWLSYAGVVIVAYVALHMIWEGGGKLAGFG